MGPIFKQENIFISQQMAFEKPAETFKELSKNNISFRPIFFRSLSCMKELVVQGNYYLKLTLCKVN